MKRTVLVVLLFLLALPIVLAQIQSSSYTVGSTHQGSSGDLGNSSSFTSQSTSTYQQPGDGDAVSISYEVNIGWFENPNASIAEEGVACGSVLTTSTTLTGNLTTNSSCLTLNASNIILDCSGHYITGNNKTGRGVTFIGVDNVTVQNCFIQNFTTGIFANQSQNSTIINNNISINKFATTLQGGYFNVSWNTIHHNYGSGTGVGLIQDAPSASSCLANGAFCFLDTECCSNSCVGAFDAPGGGTCQAAGPFGGAGSSHSTIAHNTIYNNTVAIDIIYEDNETVVNNTIYNNTIGIIVNASREINITNNTLFDNVIGVFMDNSSLIQFQDNTLQNHTDAIILEGSSEFTAQSNILLSQDYGVRISESSTNFFFYNSFNQSRIAHVNVSEDGNHFNTTVGGVAQGNIWDDIDLDNITIYDLDSDGFGDAGPQYPYNNTNFGNVSLFVQDFGPQPAQAPISCPHVLNTSTTLFSNLSVNGSCITINANDVTLDCDGHHITGTNKNGTGITVVGFNNVTVQNCFIQNFTTGIFANQTQNMTIFQNNISINMFATSLQGGYFNVSHNTIHHNYGSGTGVGLVQDPPAAGCKAVGEACSAGAECCTLICGFGGTCEAIGAFGGAGSSHSTVAFNTIYNNTVGIEVLYEDNETILNNTIYNNTLGIVINASREINITNNTIFANVISIFVDNSSIVEILDNSILNTTEDAVLLQNSDEVTLYSNTIVSQDYGIRIASGNHSLVHANTFNDSRIAHARSDIFGNHFNISVGGTPQGNFWDDIVETPLDITDSNSDGFGDSGSQYPYNNTNSGNVTGFVQDFGPITTFSAPDPVASNIECSVDNSTYVSCPSLAFGSQLTYVRANCTTQNSVTDFWFNLHNLEDNTNYIDNASFTNQSNLTFFYSAQFPIVDSGNWNLSVTCVTNTTNTISVNWSYPFGVINTTVLGGNRSVTQNQFFPISVNTSCVGGECGNVTVLLDPQGTSSEENVASTAEENSGTSLITGLFSLIDTITNPLTGLSIAEDNFSTLPITLSYNSGTLFDSDDDGIAHLDDAIDFTVAGTDTGDLDEEHLCTRWQVSSDEYITTVCQGDGTCCGFIDLQPQQDSEWDTSLAVTLETFGATANNVVSAQILYVDYSLDPDNAYSDIRLSESISLPANFTNQTEESEEEISEPIEETLNETNVSIVPEETNITEQILYDNVSIILTDSLYRVIDTFVSEDTTVLRPASLGVGISSATSEIELVNARSTSQSIFAKLDVQEDEPVSTEIFAVQDLIVDSATLTLRKIGYVDTIFRCSDSDLDFDTLDCSSWEATDISFTDNGDTITFDVSSFSAYAGGNSSAGDDSYLVVWDENDINQPNASLNKLVNDSVLFFAQWLDVVNGTSLENGTCDVTFTDGTSNMIYNATYGYFVHNRTFNTSGIYAYTVDCSHTGYSSITANDTIIMADGVTKSGAVSTIPGTVPFYTNDSNPQYCDLADSSCLLVWHVNATGSLDTTHTFFSIANTTEHSSDVIENYSNNISITIALNDSSAPQVLSTTLDPSVLTLGETTSLFMTASDNVNVNCQANISGPGSFNTVNDLCMGPGNFTPNATGLYNITYVATDGVNLTATSTAQLTVLNAVQFVVYTNNSSGPVVSNFSATFQSTGSVLYMNDSNSFYNVTLPDGIYDLFFAAFDSRLRITLSGINISNETGKTFGLDRLPTPLGGYLVNYGVNNNYTFDNATVVILYDDLNIVDESNLGLQLCSDWNFSGQNCSGEFVTITVNASQNQGADQFTYVTNGFSGFAINESPAAPAVAAASSGTGGGSSGGGSFCEYSCGDWGACQPDGTQIRTCACSCGTGSCPGEEPNTQSCNYQAPPEQITGSRPDDTDGSSRPTPEEDIPVVIVPEDPVTPVLVQKRIVGTDLWFFIAYGTFGSMLGIMGLRRIRFTMYGGKLLRWLK